MLFININNIYIYIPEKQLYINSKQRDNIHIHVYSKTYKYRAVSIMYVLSIYSSCYRINLQVIDFIGVAWIPKIK